MEEICGGKIIYQFSVLHLGWEMDNTAWVIQKPDKSRKLIFTNHGSPYETDIAELVNKIQEYEKVTKEILAAITILQETI